MYSVCSKALLLCSRKAFRGGGAGPADPAFARPKLLQKI